MRKVYVHILTYIQYAAFAFAYYGLYELFCLSQDLSIKNRGQYLLVFVTLFIPVLFLSIFAFIEWHSGFKYRAILMIKAFREFKKSIKKSRNLSKERLQLLEKEYFPTKNEKDSSEAGRLSYNSNDEQECWLDRQRERDRNRRRYPNIQ